MPEESLALSDQGMTVHLDASLIPYMQTLEIGALPDYGDGDPVFTVEETII